jgi:uncharacterized DUF497 family protein
MTYTSRVKCEWDPQKERRNIAEHGVSVREAKALFTSKWSSALDVEHMEKDT